ncbi:hypothetical protein [Pseudokineococcus sp. 1T1Z-3]|uniref:hypothetical protein n=1 Tax=Pseudokineococcus sp. 1T1Z-3 TaxID=3132745 RepID=UPI0030B739E7
MSQPPAPHGPDDVDPPPGPKMHPDAAEVDALLDADLHEVRDRGGEDGPPPEALVAAHVLGCERCRGVLEDMRAVRRLLRARAVAAPPPPPELQARIAAAVAQEAGRTRQAARRHRRRGAVALAASVVLLAGLGTAVAVSVSPLGGDGGADSVAGAGTADPGTAQLDGGGPPATTATLVLSSGTDYEPGRVADQLAAVLQAEDADGLRDALPGPSGVDLGRGSADESGSAEPAGLGDPARLAECLASLGRADAEALLVDSARWEGTPADLVVVPVPAQTTDGTGDGPGGAVQVWFVAPGCVGGQGGLRHFEVLDG